MSLLMEIYHGSIEKKTNFLYFVYGVLDYNLNLGPIKLTFLSGPTLNQVNLDDITKTHVKCEGVKTL